MRNIHVINNVLIYSLRLLYFSSKTRNPIPGRTSAKTHEAQATDYYAFLSDFFKL